MLEDRCHQLALGPRPEIVWKSLCAEKGGCGLAQEARNQKGVEQPALSLNLQACCVENAVNP